MPAIYRPSFQGSINVLHRLAKEVREKGAEGISMILGEPEFDRPEILIEAEMRALQGKGLTGYADTQGFMPLREEIAADMKARWGCEYNPQREILVTAGAKEALALIALAITGPKKEPELPRPFLAVEPVWPGYNGMEELADSCIEVVPRSPGVSVSQAMAAYTGKDLSPDDEIAGILVNSPNNPSGEVLHAAALQELLDLAKKADAYLIEDAVYHRFVFDNKVFQPAAALPGAKEQVIFVNSASKSYKMTGARVGWICGPEELVWECARLHSNLVTCINPASQEAVRAVLSYEANRAAWLVDQFKEGDDPKVAVTMTYPWVREYQRRRDAFFEALAAMPGFGEVPQQKPQGTFFAWVNIAGFPMGSELFCRRLLNEFGVGAAPGAAFGGGCDHFVRYSLTVPQEKLEEALARHRQFAEKYAKRVYRSA